MSSGSILKPSPGMVPTLADELDEKLSKADDKDIG